MPIATMMSLIRAAVFEACPAPDAERFSSEKLAYLYHLSKKHDMAHLVGYSLLPLSADFPGDETLPKFKKQYLLSVLRYENLSMIKEAIETLFEAEKIPHIALKGSLLRKYYPEPWMRTSCDIDILVKEEDLDRAETLLIETLHYTRDSQTQHDISFNAPNGIHIELHHSLIEDDVLGEADKPLLGAWEAAHLAEGTLYRYVFSDELFYYYHIAHMAKHFVHGGCGIRPFLDLVILREALHKDPVKTEALLTAGGLSTFAQKAEALADVWFLGKEHTDLSRMMEGYLLNGGTYGTIENQVVVNQRRKGSKFRYLLSRIFMPTELLSVLYPSLNKHRWLMPLYQVRRWFRLLLPSHMKRAWHEIKLNQTTSKETQSAADTMLDELGLQ